MNKRYYHILVIDDDTRLRNLLAKYLSESGFYISTAKDIWQAKKEMADFAIDLLVVDVMMPIMSGVEFTKSLRENANDPNSSIPILMLTAMGEPNNRIDGLEAGADDYLPKPFEPKELLLRINNILKRSNEIKNKDQKITCCFGDFTFNFADLRLKKNDQFIYLTESEAKILSILGREIGKVVAREQLSILCGAIDERSIDVQITRLRRKIEENPKTPHFLQTVRNQGYILYK